MGVITKIPSEKGRGRKQQETPIACRARELKIPTLETTSINDDPLCEKLLKESDLGLVFAFSQFLKQKILSLPRLGFFNIHPSLLPQFRGAAPLQHALWQGLHETGISIQKMALKMDSGPLALQTPLPLYSWDTSDLLHKRAAYKSALLLEEFLKIILKNSLILKEQEGEISFAPCLKKEQGHLLFSQHSAEFLERSIRAFHSWPGSFFFLEKKRIKVLEAKILTLSENIRLLPGEISFSHGQFWVQCQQGSLHLTKLQCEGKNICSDEDFVRGFQNQNMKKDSKYVAS